MKHVVNVKFKSNLLLSLVWIGVLCVTTHTALAKLTVDVEPDQLKLGETLRLTITQDDPQSIGVPDLITLEKDFSIVETERSTSYTVINGQARSLNQWGIVLMPKRAGTYSIPSINVGKEQTQPSKIVVSNNGVSVTTQNDAIPQQNNDVMLTAEATPQTPFLNQQVLYTVKLYNRQRLLDAEYQPPKVEDGLLIPLGNGRHYQTELNGQTYSVDEQKYAIFPQKSGELMIHPPVFKALVYGDLPQQVIKHGQSIKLNVKPMQGQPTTWLPAKEVTLSDQLEQSESTLTEGSTITRVVTLQAVAVPAQLIPTLTFTGNAHVSVYPEKPKSKNRLKQNELVSTQIIKVTYVLNKAGQVELPKIDQAWFDTSTGKFKIASLPARVIHVTPRPGNNNASATNIPMKNNKNQAVKPLLTQTVSQQSHHPLLWLGLGFSVAWLMIVAFWGVQQLKRVPHQKKLAYRALREACIKHNPHQAREALLDWGLTLWPTKRLLNLRDLEQLIPESRFKKQLHLLSLALYSQNGLNKTWRGDDLWHCVQHFKVNKVKQSQNRYDLPGIHPA